MDLRILQILIFCLLSANQGMAQFSCVTADEITSLPFTSATLSTSTGASFQASGVCNDNYNEQNYIFKYTPQVDENIQISVQKNNFELGGIYVFTECDQPPSNCIAYEETEEDLIDLSFIFTAGQEYYIFVGTESTDDFVLEITKEQVAGVALNKPEATQALDVNGAIRVGSNTTTPYEGTIRWNAESRQFEGYNGSEWLLLSPPQRFGQISAVGVGKTALDASVDDDFGKSVSVSGAYAVVGASGANSNQGKAYVFRKEGSKWVEEAVLTASDGLTGDFFGWSVSISGEFIIIGAPSSDVNGSAMQGKGYVYRKDISLWVEEAVLTASDGISGDFFGWSVSISAEYAVVGANAHDVNGTENQGKAYIFRRSGTSWLEEAQLTSLDGTLEDNFGESVSISGDYVIVGARYHDVNGTQDQGKAYVFKRSGITWTQEASLIASDGAVFYNFGTSVSIAGEFAIVGAPLHSGDGGINQGKVYIFRRTGVNWIEEIGICPTDGATFDRFGCSVSISGNLAVIGAHKRDTNGNVDQGKAYVFKRLGNSWIEEASLIVSDGKEGDFLGYSVSISGNDIIVGAQGVDFNGLLNTGKVYFY